MFDKIQAACVVFLNKVGPALAALKEQVDGNPDARAVSSLLLEKQLDVLDVQSSIQTLLIPEHTTESDALALHNIQLSPYDEEGIMDTLTDNGLKRRLLQYSRDYNQIVDLLTQKPVDAGPSPSNFAGPKWGTYCKEAASLRNGFQKERGPPLVAIHFVFPLFKRLIYTPVPKEHIDYDKINIAAARLCTRMSQAYNSEDGRMEAWDECLVDLRKNERWTTKQQMRSSQALVTWEADTVKWFHGVPVGVVELKNDFVQQAADAYHQCTRDAQLFIQRAEAECRSNEEKHNKAWLGQGAPMLLLAMTGYLVCAAGAVRVGEQVVVEILSPGFYMLRDGINDDCKVDALASLLYAVSETCRAIERSIQSHVTNETPHAFPFIYNNATIKVDGSSTTLRVTGLKDWRHFVGCLDGCTPTRPVFVKLTKGQNNYGVQVHQLLARHDLAPRYYGNLHTDHVPTAHVMELLDPAEWITVTDLRSRWMPSSLDKTEMERRKEQWEEFIEGLKSKMEIVYQHLEHAGFVHGDLRPNNIVVRARGGDAVLPSAHQLEIQILDFDWSGRAGEVCYPHDRNPNIAEWEGYAGGPIEKDHDKKVFETCCMAL